ncbi:MAG TPA: hypothetical protein VMA75_03490 [Candidatus Paceibacterota bacterium]|nr:hypothetical protein [Candidatus Paceibacterota bacterium]
MPHAVLHAEPDYSLTSAQLVAVRWILVFCGLYLAVLLVLGIRQFRKIGK